MATLTPEKLTELMLKVRKGATASLNPAQVQAILEAIGGYLETIVGFSSYKGSRIYKDTEKEAQDLHKEVSKHLVSSLPSKPKIGVLYVTSVQEPEEHLGMFVVKFEAFVGTGGVRIELGGKREDIFKHQGNLTDIRDVLKGAKKQMVPIYTITGWLNEETDWVARINKHLQVEEHTPGMQRTRDQTGSCPVCFQNVKMSSGRTIVLHGYERPGHGSVEGKCFGVGYPPFELSVKGTLEYLELSLAPRLASIKRALTAFKSGSVDELYLERSKKKITPSDPEWDVVRRRKIDELESDQERSEVEVEAYTRLRDHWAERDLPKEGDARIDWFHKGQKSAASASSVALAVVVASRFIQASGWKIVNPRDLDESDREAVWDMYVKTYTKIGLTQSSLSSMISEYDVWELFSDGGQLRAFSVSRKTPFGTKSGLSGSDGSPEGKAAIKSYLINVYKRPGRYSEVSHVVEHLALSGGAPVVCPDNVETVLKKPIETHDDGIHYKRPITGVGLVTKIMVGTPRGVPITSAKNPSCELRTSGEEPANTYAGEEDPCDLDAHYSCQIDLE